MTIPVTDSSGVPTGTTGAWVVGSSTHPQFGMPNSSAVSGVTSILSMPREY
jgi:hypothetical protein